MQTSRCGADAFYLTNMKAAEHKNVGVGCVWLESWLLGLTGRFKTFPWTSRQFGSSTYDLSRNLYKCLFHLCPLPHQWMYLQMQDRACTHFTYYFADLLSYFNHCKLWFSVLLCHSLGLPWQHRNWNYSPLHCGHAVTLLDSCQAPIFWKNLDGFSKSALRDLSSMSYKGNFPPNLQVSPWPKAREAHTDL